MKEEITGENLKTFRKKYQENQQNKEIEKEITKNGIASVCEEKNKIVDTMPKFTIELPETKRYNQKETFRCWIFAGLNFIKYNVMQNLNGKEEIFSANYISFYDRLEKSNNLYEIIIQTPNITFEQLHEKEIVIGGVEESGYWEYFSNIVEKYGLVPESVMPETVNNSNSSEMNQLYSEKIKKDIIDLMKAKQNGMKIETMREQKETFLQENYNFLSKVLGEPVQEFEYEWTDNKGQEHKEKMTPRTFKEKFLTIDLKEYVAIGNIPMEQMPYERLYVKKYRKNVYGKSIQLLNLPIKYLKQYAVAQLKEGNPVCFGCRVKVDRDRKKGILDTNLYHYEEKLGIRRLTKTEALKLDETLFEHVMTITGVHILDGKIKKWKIEDSYGETIHKNGYYIMDDTYFDKYVFYVVIHKTYLSKEHQELLTQEPIGLENNCPF